MKLTCAHLLLVGASCIAVLATFSGARAETAAVPETAYVDDAELVIHWSRYVDSTVSVGARFRCYDETRCVMPRRDELSHEIRVDISNINDTDQRKLIFECYQDCDVQLVGKFTKDRLFASRVVSVKRHHESPVMHLTCDYYGDKCWTDEELESEYR